jgi:hypothetical protein
MEDYCTRNKIKIKKNSLKILGFIGSSLFATNEEILHFTLPEIHILIASRLPTAHRATNSFDGQAHRP